MRTLIDLPIEVLEKYGEIAKKEYRSRKAFMEWVLVEYVSKTQKKEEKTETFGEITRIT